MFPSIHKNTPIVRELPDEETLPETPKLKHRNNLEESTYKYGFKPTTSEKKSRSKIMDRSEER